MINFSQTKQKIVSKSLISCVLIQVSLTTANSKRLRAAKAGRSLRDTSIYEVVYLMLAGYGVNGL